MRVNEYMKLICRKNLTVWDYVLYTCVSTSIPWYFYQHTQQCVWEIYNEHAGWDPKDGELCLIKLKPGETLVED